MRRALREDDRDGVRDLAAAERPVHDQVEPGPRRAQYPASHQEIVSRREVRERTGIRARQRRAAGLDREAEQRVGRLFDQIESPALIGLSVEARGAALARAYPRSLPDLDREADQRRRFELIEE